MLLSREKNWLWSFFIVNLCAALMVAIFLYLDIKFANPNLFQVIFHTALFIFLCVFTYYAYIEYNKCDNNDEEDYNF